MMFKAELQIPLSLTLKPSRLKENLEGYSKEERRPTHHRLAVVTETST
jgi:hypothetical protein